MNRMRDCGVALVFFAIILTALLAMSALVIGVGFMVSTKLELDTRANLAALSAIQAYVEDPSTDTQAKALAAQLRVKKLLDDSGVMRGITRNFTALTTRVGGNGPIMGGAEDGEIQFGVHYLRDDDLIEAGSPCRPPANTSFPCFDPRPTNTTSVNAVRVTLDISGGTNWFTVPFAYLLGAGPLELSSNAIAMITPRCFVYALDVSGSVTSETHQVLTLNRRFTARPPMVVDRGDTSPRRIALVGGALGPAAPNPRFGDLDNLAPMAFPDRTWNLANCTKNPQSDLEIFRCNMHNERGSSALDGVLGNTPEAVRSGNIRYHYSNDYRSFLVRTPEFTSLFWVDSYYNDPSIEPAFPPYDGPQPWTRLMRAFNGGLRAIDALDNNADRGRMLVFAGRVLDTEPPPPTASNPSPPILTNDLDRLIQLTNVFNRGMVDVFGETRFEERGFNAVTRGWFPMPIIDEARNSTNTVDAMVSAIQALASCPAGSVKSIILATDGIGTCRNIVDIDPTSQLPVIRPNSTDCAPQDNGLNAYSFYQESENQLLSSNILSVLKNRDIAVTVILDSQSVGPAFVNRLRDNPLDPRGKYYSPEELLAKSDYCALPGSYGCPATFVPGASGATGPKKLFADDRPVIPEDRATGGVLEQAFEDWLQLDRTLGGCKSASGPPCDENDLAVRNEFAMLAMGFPGIAFRKPYLLWSHIARETGGVVCTVQRKCGAADVPPGATCATPYDENGRLKNDCYAGDNQSQQCSALDQSEASQALSCVLGAVGQTAYSLVTERRP